MTNNKHKERKKTNKQIPQITAPNRATQTDPLIIITLERHAEKIASRKDNNNEKTPPKRQK